MRPRTAYTLLAVFAFVAALAAALYLRQKAPPEVARLLPESEAIVYVNLRPLRLATHFDQKPISPNSFGDFIVATGILPERDIDSVAFALHQMPNPNGPNGLVGFTEVFEGRFDRNKLSAYLAAHSAAQETYAGRTIYAVPSEQGRTVRVALLGYDMVAASNMPTTEQIHSILDRQRAAASPFAGSSLLSTLYPHVPAFSSAWAVGEIGLPSAEKGRIAVLGLQLPLAPDTEFVASLRYTTALHLRIDELTATDEDAVRSARALNSLLSVARALEQAQNPAESEQERALRQLADSISIEQHKDRATLTATLPLDALKRLAPR